MSTRAWWLLAVIIYLSLVVWALSGLDSGVTCSATYPC